MAYVYVSFHPQDAALLPLLQKQVPNSVDLYASQVRAGGELTWQPEDALALRRCDVMLVVQSPYARATDLTGYEWSTAIAAGTPAVVLLLREVAVHPALEQAPRVDFTAGPRWDELATLLDAILSPAPASEAGAGQAPPTPRDVTPAAHPPDVDPLANAPAMVRNAFAALESMDPEERETALENLRSMSHPSSSDALVAAMNLPSKEVRLEAARALAERGDKRAVPGLLELIREEDYDTAWDAAWGLVRLGDPSIVPGLIEAMRAPSNNARKAAAYALSQIGEPALEPLLASRHDSTQSVRLGAYEALGQIGEPAVEPLVEDLRHPDEQIQEVAASTLRVIGSPAAVPLIRALRSEDRQFRRAAGRVLVELGDNAVEALARGLRAKNRQISQASAVLLERIDTERSLNALDQWHQEQGG